MLTKRYPIIGETHECGEVLQERPLAFYWRGRYFSAPYCKKCNSIYETKEFIDYTIETSKEQESTCN